MQTTALRRLMAIILDVYFECDGRILGEKHFSFGTSSKAHIHISRSHCVFTQQRYSFNKPAKAFMCHTYYRISLFE